MIAKGLPPENGAKVFAIMKTFAGAPKISRWCAKRVRASGWS
jgi:hypothetical protein